MVVHDHDAVVMKLAGETWSKYGKQDSNICTDLRGNPNWSNLLRWCKDYHEDPGMFVLSVSDSSPNHEAVCVSAMFDSIRAARSLPWPEMLIILEAMRKLMVLRNPAWAT